MSTLSIDARCAVLCLIQLICLPLFIMLAAQPVHAVGSNGSNYNGALNGEFDVSPSGAATYSIPIDAVPGIGGLTPQLALSYSSQSANGLLGVGWSLSGLSSIRRCPTTLAQDGFIDAVDFDSNDRYCLDGKRLVEVSNTGCSGGTEYRTEIDSYARICAYETAGVGAAWFKVWTKAGLKMEYANSTDSRIEGQGIASVVVWAVNRIDDVAGNYLKVSYIEDNANGEYRVDRIDYAGNEAEGTLPYHSVRFVYESRGDVVQGYIDGKLLQTSVRMSAVQVYAGETARREYRLEYVSGLTTSRSRISSLKQCDGVGPTAQCLPETALTWSEGSASFDAKINTGKSTGGYQIVHPMDVNGDGKTDLAYCTLPSVINGAASWQFLISSGSGFNAAINTGTPCTNSNYSIPINYDSDGKMDLLVPYANGNWYVLRSTGTTFEIVDTDAKDSGYTNKPVVLDVNGDGRDDVALVYSSKWYLRINNGNGFDAAVSTGIASTGWEYRLKIDYDGDGLDDVLLPYANKRWYVLNSTGTGFTLKDTGSADTGHEKNPQVIDVDGDGRQDLVVSGSSKLEIFFNRGNGFKSSVTTTGTPPAYASWPLDYNGDGKMDLLITGSPGSSTSTTWYILQSTGVGFKSINSKINVSGYDVFYGRYPKPGDYNGDGYYDLALDVNSVWDLLLHSGGVPDQLMTIRQGSGIDTDVSYKPLTDSSVYTAGASVYPQLSLNSPVYVVSSVAMSNGLGGSNTRTYTYFDARTDMQGRGFLGFRTMTVTDLLSQIQSLNTYSQTYPYIGLLESADMRLLDAVESSKTSATVWGSSQPYTGVYQVFQSSLIETSYELDASLISSSVKTQSAHDEYGNPGQTLLHVTGEGGEFSTTTISSYGNDASQWRLGRVVNTTITRATPSGIATRTFAYEYDAGSGLLSAEIIEPGDPQLLRRTEYTYDNYGNKESVTVKDSGSNAYPVTTTSSSADYDFSQLDVDGTYYVTNKNAKLHSETQIIDAGSGKIMSLTGPNGLTTYWQYDSFGRQINETRPDDTASSVVMLWCDSACAGVSNAVYKVQTQSSGVAPVTLYYDSHGRELRSETVNLTGVTVYKDTEHNALGQLVRISRPYTGNTPLWTDYLYDKLGRVWKETRADGGITETTYRGSTTDLRQYSVNDSHDQTTSYIKNVEGLLIQTIDAANNDIHYEYDAFGNLTRMTDSANNTTLMEYDLHGLKISMDDPDMGHWEYRYDALGQLRWQKDAKLQEVTMSYDVLGRMLRRVEPEGTSTWTYDEPGSKGIGKVWKVTGANGYSETYVYDAYGRPSQTSQLISQVTFTTSTSYDLQGRIDTLTYPNGFKLKHAYNSHGYLDKLSNAGTDGEVYWLAQESSADGQITSELLGNGVQTVRTIDSASGRMIYVGSYSGSTNVQMLTYAYDAMGNLKSRADAVQTLDESFEYDDFNRLTKATITGLGSKTWSYDNLGNLLSKDGYVDYAYGLAGDKPHAVTSARGNSYAYDANGNLQAGGGRTLTWNSANLPTKITKGSVVVDFKYSPDRVRYKQVSSANGVSTTTVYAGKLYEKVSSGSKNTHKNYIYAGGRVVAVREHTNAAQAVVKYLHQDHLGSTDVITDAAGQVLERQSFDAFGSRRVASNWGAPGAIITSLYSSRGYTGHEQLDGVGLIHMNGRVYAPELGRFISPDPFVQDPSSQQSLNRYSYTENNPLSMKDPSGYFLGIGGWLGDVIDDAFDWIDNNIIQPIGNFIGVDKQDFQNYAVPIIAAFSAPWTGLYIGTTFGFSTTAGYALTGFTAGYIASGGDLMAGLAGAVTAVGFYGLENLYGSSWTLGRVVGNSTVGGVSSVVQGGEFKDGFKMNFMMSSLTYLNYTMRDAMISQSKLMPCTAETSCNSNGISAGLRGDGFKLAGARQLYDTLGNFLGLDECTSNAGGCQGVGRQVANLLGFSYQPGGVVDSLAESFAGPHDWLRNQTGAYNVTGNAVQYSGAYGLVQDYALNYGLLVPAAPIALAGLVAQYPGLTVGVQSSIRRK